MREIQKNHRAAVLAILALQEAEAYLSRAGLAGQATQIRAMQEDVRQSQVKLTPTGAF